MLLVSSSFVHFLKEFLSCVIKNFSGEFYVDKNKTRIYIFGMYVETLCIMFSDSAGNFLSSVETLPYNGFKTVLEIDTMGTFNVSKAAFSKFFKVRFLMLLDCIMQLFKKYLPRNHLIAFLWIVRIRHVNSTAVHFH